MKKTYRIILENVNGKPRECILVLDKNLITKCKTGYAHGVQKEPNVRPKSRSRKYDA